MPKYSSRSQSQSQSQKSSKSQSKNGGRGRKKRTMKKDRRVKRRKVMMVGGGDIVTWDQLKQKLVANGVTIAFTKAMGREDNDFDTFKNETMKKTQNSDTVDLSRIKSVISTKVQYSNAVKAIDELIAESKQ